MSAIKVISDFSRGMLIGLVFCSMAYAVSVFICLVLAGLGYIPMPA